MYAPHTATEHEYYIKAVQVCRAQLFFDLAPES